MINYEQLRAAVDTKLSMDPEFRTIMKRINSGRATFIDTARYSQVLSHILGSEVSKMILNVDDREAVVSHLLHDSYEDINDVFGRVQSDIDKKKGLNIKPRQGEYPGERVEQFVHSLVDPTVEDSVIERRARAGTETITKSFHDDCIEENAKLHEEAGLKTYIIRMGTNCCPWCSEVAGKYEMKDQPQGIFRRHDNCDCTVIYDGQVLRGQAGYNGKRSKKWVEVPKDAGAVAPTRLTQEQAKSTEYKKTSEQSNNPVFRSYPLKGSSEIQFDKIDGSAAISPELRSEYYTEYDRFTSVFGELSTLSGIDIAPYDDDNIYGRFFPESRKVRIYGVGGKSGKSFIINSAQAHKKTGEWSTGSLYHSFRHELGHALQMEHLINDVNWESKQAKINELFQSLQDELTNLKPSDIIKFKKKKLSLYGFEDVSEFISESVAEFIQNPKKARSTSKQVVSIILGEG